MIHLQYRPASALSGRMSENHFTVSNIPYGPQFQVQVVQGPYVKEIINWTGLNLCSSLQVSQIPTSLSKFKNAKGLNSCVEILMKKECGFA